MNEKACPNCQYSIINFNKEPCSNCIDKCNFIPNTKEETKEETKTMNYPNFLINPIDEFKSYYGLMDDEIFKIENNMGKSIIGEYYFKDYEFFDTTYNTCPITLNKLLAGVWKVQEENFTPTDGQEYFFIDNNLNSMEPNSIGSAYFKKNDIFDLMNYNFGNCFRTEIIAKRNQPIICKKYKEITDKINQLNQIN